MTRQELLALPMTTDLQTAGRALGMGRTQSYELAARGEFPVRLLKLGCRYKVVTGDLLTLPSVDARDPRGGDRGDAA